MLWILKIVFAYKQLWMFLHSRGHLHGGERYDWSLMIDDSSRLNCTSGIVLYSTECAFESCEVKASQHSPLENVFSTYICLTSWGIFPSQSTWVLSQHLSTRDRPPSFYMDMKYVTADSFCPKYSKSSAGKITTARWAGQNHWAACFSPQWDGSHAAFVAHSQNPQNHADLPKPSRAQPDRNTVHLHCVWSIIPPI